MLTKFASALTVLMYKRAVCKPVSCIQSVKFSTTKDSQKSPNKVVFISQSTDIFANLAIEAWLYKNWCFDKRHLLFLWRNAPCVVIGRFQNPFAEANVSYLESAGVPIARRYSGGGTVYHDMGNLNLTFFTPRHAYNRQWNLEVIQKTLQEDFDIDVAINARHDLVTDKNLKVSGSAAKLSKDKAYHHCSLLLSADHKQLSLALKGDLTIDSRATESVRSPVGNLSSSKGPALNDAVFSKLAFKYLEASLPNHPVASAEENRSQSHGLTLINPRDDWFPGHGEIMDELKSWDWIYGKTPHFIKTIHHPLPLYLRQDNVTSVSLDIHCINGKVEKVSVGKESVARVSNELQLKIETEVSSGLKGTPYTLDMQSSVDSLMRFSQPHCYTVL